MTTNSMSEFIQRVRMAAPPPNGTGQTDGQLLADYIDRGDQAALTALVRQHGPMVWSVCRRLLDNYHDAEDAFQATFLVLVRRAAVIRPRERVANWLYGVAHQTALKARSTAAKTKGRQKQVNFMPDPASTEQDLMRDLRAVIDQELSSLPDKYRTLIVLCDLEDKTRKEAARQLGCPEGTVAGRLARARTILAKRLARHGLAVSGGALAALSQQAASAGEPSWVMSSTINAASQFATGQAAGLISVRVADLTRGVLRNMYLTKLKTVMMIILAVGVMAVTAVGFAYRATATEPNSTENKPVQPNSAAERSEAAKQDANQLELQLLQAEIERVREINDELKKRLQQQVRKGKTDVVKFVIKVYPVVLPGGGLTEPVIENARQGEELIRTITRTVEPTSWSFVGGEGSIEYSDVAGSLVVRQSPDIQKQIQDLLEALWKSKAEQEKRLLEKTKAEQEKVDRERSEK